MSSKRFDFRVGIGRSDGPRSSVWHFFSRKDHVYAAHASMGGIEKFSFHPPNICRRAFDKHYDALQGFIPRREALHSWLRDATPAGGHNKVVRVLRVGFATDLLSTSLEPLPNKNIHWVPPAPSGGSTVLDLFFTRDSEESLLHALSSEPPDLTPKLIAYRMLRDGEAFSLSYWQTTAADQTLRMPASHGHTQDLIVYPVDIHQTGRPVRLTLFSNPGDGDFMHVWEMGAFWHPPLTDDEWKSMRAPYAQGEQQV